MIIKGTNIEIPDSLVVDGDLDLSRSHVKELPDGLYVVGNLNMNGTKNTELPKNLHVGGSFYLSGSAVVELPKNLHVGGVLYVYGTPINELPFGLRVSVVYSEDGQLVASEKTQLEWILKGDDMLQIFKSPTDAATRLHEMMWKI